jgi:peptidoglycan/xylan/chitin deacetylase (PgdA/CDA1 family)
LKVYKHRSTSFTRSIYPSLIWKIATKEKHIYLTFDDGPTPIVTDKVLDLLNQYKAKATFFCVGKNVQNHTHIYKKILLEGHSIGNHTQNHLNGWKTSLSPFLQDVEDASKYIESIFFRPPYGKLTPIQIIKLKKKYKIVMWSCLSGDFDDNLNIEHSLKQLKIAAQPGAIIVFHDSKKAERNLFEILPEYLQYLASEGFVTKAL